MKSETLHRTDNSAVTDVVLEKKKLLLHRVFEFGNPSKYVPRVTGLNFLNQVRCSAILIPRFSIATIFIHGNLVISTKLKM